MTFSITDPELNSGGRSCRLPVYQRSETYIFWPRTDGLFKGKVASYIFSSEKLSITFFWPRTDGLFKGKVASYIFFQVKSCQLLFFGQKPMVYSREKLSNTFFGQKPMVYSREKLAITFF